MSCPCRLWCLPVAAHWLFLNPGGYFKHRSMAQYRAWFSVTGAGIRGSWDGCVNLGRGTRAARLILYCSYKMYRMIKAKVEQKGRGGGNGKWGGGSVKMAIQFHSILDCDIVSSPGLRWIRSGQHDILHGKPLGEIKGLQKEVLLIFASSFSAQMQQSMWLVGVSFR